MVHVVASTVINAPTARVWACIRDFNGLPQWHPAIADSRIEGNEPPDRVGCVRHFHTRDGALIREQLRALSDHDCSCTYRILESPMGVANYVATLQLMPITDGDRSFARWSACFDCEPVRQAELSALIGGAVFQGGLDALVRRFAAG